MRPSVRAPSPGLLPPEDLIRLGPLELIARLVVEGTLAGRHRSPGRGGSLEFAEHRPYARGDDLRRVDWKVYGRTDRWFVRESEEETNLRATLVLDASASMAWGSDGVSKWDYARLVVAALAHLLLEQRDAVGLATFAGSLTGFVAPGGGRGQRARLMAALEGARPGGETAPEGPFKDLAERLPRRGLLVLVSDLLGPPGRFLPGLRFFRQRKHEVVVFHVLDRLERDPEGLGQAPGLVDVETRRRLEVGPRDLAEGYRAELARLEGEYRAQAHDRGFDFVPLTTDRPVAEALGQWLDRRR